MSILIVGVGESSGVVVTEEAYDNMLVGAVGVFTVL